MTTKETIEKLETEKPQPVIRDILETDVIIGFRIIHNRLIHLWLLDRRTSAVRRVEFSANEFEQDSLALVQSAIDGLELYTNPI